MARRGFGLRSSIAAALAGLLGPRTRGLPADWSTPDAGRIRQILADRIDVQGQGVGIVVGVVDPTGRRVIGHGDRGIDHPDPLDGETIFEIGSMTKVFTALLLADMAARGEVGLDQPLSELLPRDVKTPSGGRRDITLADLATHTSGLPGLPTNFAPADPENPYADYSVGQLYAFLNSHTLRRAPGSAYEYSNLGAGLLGHVLSLRAGQTYETLLRDRISTPLGLTATSISLTPDLRSRLATGHTVHREPSPYWDLPTLAGAGALRSTANDMLTFLAAALDLGPSTLKPMMDTLLKVRRPGPDRETDMALGWHISRAPGGDVPWHDGGTGGFRSFFSYHPARRTGVVVLANHANAAGVADIGGHILTGRELAILSPPPILHAIRLSAADLVPLVGTYDHGGGARIVVSQEDDRLFVQVAGQVRYEVFPATPDRFFWKVADAQLTFRRDTAGHVEGAVLRQDGRDLSLQRVAP